MKITFTLCSNNYLAQAKVLIESFLNNNPDYNFIIGLVDGLHPDIDYSFFSPAEIVQVTHIDIPDLSRLIKKYNIVEFNTAVKPFFFEYLFKHYSPEHIIYLDPDIAIYSSFTEVDELLKRESFLLTPHLLTINPNKEPEKERQVLNVGNFNLGFLALRNDADVKLMLKWWKERMRQYCYIDFCSGLFVDQIWANYIPSYFRSYHILRSFGYNVGYWNFDERFLSKENGKYIVNNSWELIFFHFSSFNPLEHDKLCKWLNYSFEKRPDLSEIYEVYTVDLLNNHYAKFSKLTPLMDFKVEPLAKKGSGTLSIRQRIGYKLNSISRKALRRIFDLE